MSTGNKPVVFFSRCKPGTIDASALAVDRKKVFFGYVRRKSNVPYDPQDAANCVISPLASDEDWIAGVGKIKPQHTMNRNLALKRVPEHSIALVPRPEEGVVYAGCVGLFRIKSDPELGAKLIALFAAQNPPLHDSEKDAIAAEVTQGWDVTEFRPIPLPLLPGWLRKSLFGRSTYGVIPEGPQGEDAVEVIVRLLRGEAAFPRLSGGSTASAIQQTLTNVLTPPMFEHLTVDLLQLEEPEKQWLSSGGVGDGGVDGIALDSEGRVIDLLQCKLVARGETGSFSGWAHNHGAMATFAYMLGTPPQDRTSVRVLGPDWITEKVMKHKDRLPLAITIGIAT